MGLMPGFVQRIPADATPNCVAIRLGLPAHTASLATSQDSCPSPRAMKRQRAVLRALVATLLVVLVSTVVTEVSHSQVPDTVEAFRYFPLRTGNQWHYQESHGTERWIVGEDTTIDVATYHRVLNQTLAGDGTIVSSSTKLLRYDTLSATVWEYANLGQGSESHWHALPGCLDAPFTNIFDCEPANDRYTVLRPKWPYYIIDADTVHAPEAKEYDTLGGYFAFIADIGLTTRTFEGGESSMSLIYARVDSVSIGTPVIATGTESQNPRVAAVQVIETIYPNPTRSEATVVVASGAGQLCALRVLDVTGRLKQTLPLTFGARRTTLDVAELSPGVYFVQADACGVSEIQKLVVL